MLANVQTYQQQKHLVSFYTIQAHILQLQYKFCNIGLFHTVDDQVSWNAQVSQYKPSLFYTRFGDILSNIWVHHQAKSQYLFFTFFNTP